MRPPPTEPCWYCPAGKRCNVIKYRHGAYCDAVDPDSGKFVEGMADLLRAQSLNLKSYRRGLARDIAVSRAITACRVRQVDGCACGAALCFRSGYPRRVTVEDCRSCPVATLIKR